MNTHLRIERVMVAMYPDEHACLDGPGPAIGLVAEATVSRPAGRDSRRMQRFTSMGLWGIGSDSSDDYLQEVAAEELSDLKRHLTAFGVSTAAVPPRMPRGQMQSGTSRGDRAAEEFFCMWDTVENDRDKSRLGGRRAGH